MCQPLTFGLALNNSLDTERVATVWTKGWLSLSRLCSVGNEGLQAELGTPFESAAAALLDLAGRTIPSCLIATGAAVEIKQDVVLAIDVTAFVALNLEKIEFFAILMRAAVADVFEYAFVLDHPCGHEPRSSMKVTSSKPNSHPHRHEHHSQSAVPPNFIPPV